MSESPQFPARYEPLSCLGRGAGGEVWSVRDRFSGHEVAFKLLQADASDQEVLALVREATLLSGLQSADVPRVLHFGRLPGDGRAFLVRELVEGQSLHERAASWAMRPLLSALAYASDVLTALHRSDLLHGDVKPANIIVRPDGRATLIDLGLAAPWQQGGAVPQGLTPRFAAPELFQGARLTPRVEVYALGATLSELLVQSNDPIDEPMLSAVEVVADRAMSLDPAERFPSVDEFALALRSAAELEPSSDDNQRAWVVGNIDDVCDEIAGAIKAMPSSGGLVVCGPSGAGRTTALRRVSWSLGLQGHEVVFFEGTHVTGLMEALEIATRDHDVGQLTLVIDDGDELGAAQWSKLDGLRQRGARLVVVLAGQGDGLPGATFALFEFPSLADEQATRLVKRLLPSIGDSIVSFIVERADGNPAVLRGLIEGLKTRAIVSVEDLQRHWAEQPSHTRHSVGDIHAMLDRGRFEQAAAALEEYGETKELGLALAWAKLLAGRGKPSLALERLERAESLLEQASLSEVAAWHLQTARAMMRLGRYGDGEAQANMALARLAEAERAAEVEKEVAYPRDLVADALSVAGLTQSFGGRHDEAIATLEHSVQVARSTDNARLVALALVSLAFALQRNDKLDGAHDAYVEALSYSEKASDAGLMATTRLNLATVAQARADLAATILHLEAAVDLGQRAGQASNVRQALLNLANLDLYLGRAERARGAIEQLATARDALPEAVQAQLLGLEAQLAMLTGDVERATTLCGQCAAAYEVLGRKLDAAEALLELILMNVDLPAPETEELTEALRRADALLENSDAHRVAHTLARGHLARIDGQANEAAERFDEATALAAELKQPQWQWRALVARQALHALAAETEDAERCRNEALEILSAVADSLPRDLKEVFWSEPRRRAIRQSKMRSTELVKDILMVDLDQQVSTASTMHASSADEERVGQLLEINRRIAGVHDLERLLETVTDYAVGLVGAERGFVLLRSRRNEDELSVHAGRERDGSDPHRRFSETIANRVVSRGKPFIAIDAPGDDRVSMYVSQHSLSLRSVACVPIRARTGRTIGALYLETRLSEGRQFKDELPMLLAFADQVAIAIETARLIGENKARTKQLEEANEQLKEAQRKLEQTLGRRTEQLQHTRRDLRSARAALRSHFGYQGIVGASPVMRKVFDIIERIKDNDVPVLLTGESGTGKEVVAKAIHTGGNRSKKRFVGVNCGAIPEHLLESELFGHVRGAFTGAHSDKKGLFRELDGGTILLDEIGEMPEKMQAGLLRVLQERTVRPVGGNKECPVDTRVIAATHRDLKKMVSEGTFREDLFYRLDVIAVPIPSLRERREDIPLLVEFFLRMFAARYGRDARALSREAMNGLMAQSWPGNVRQLENVLLNAWILSDGDELAVDDFELLAAAVTTPQQASVSAPVSSAIDHEQRDKAQIIAALEKTGWNRAQAAKDLGIPRRTFYRRLKRYGIQ